MPANLTPQYFKAEQAFKEAKTVEDKIAALEEMLAVMPKHKGTDHLQADLRRRISKLRDEASKPKSKKSFDPFRIDKGGAGQVLLLGAPNSGKSAIVSRLSNAPTQPAAFPFATQGPIPGMMLHEDVQIQLVDLPPITADYFPKGMMGLVKAADAVLLVADLGADSLLEDLEAVLQSLEGGRVDVVEPGRGPAAETASDGHSPPTDGSSEERQFPFRVRLLGLLLANKADLPDGKDRLEILRDLYRGRFDPIPISSETGEGLGELPAAVFRMLDCIRVYSKQPGKPADLTAPFVLKRGETVLDLAAKIHRDFPDHLKQARVWGSSRFEGQAVHKDYVLVDRDIVELHVNI